MPDTTTSSATTSIEAVIIDLDKGRFSDDATTALAAVVDAVCKHGGKGKITMTIEVEPQDPKTFEDTGVLLLTPKVEAKVPQRAHGPAIFYATGIGGAITREDPHRDDPRD